MRFIAPSHELLHHLMKVQGAIISKPLVPILENFLFDIKGNKLSIFSTDLETSMTTEMTVEASDEMKIAVPSRMVLETLRSLGNTPVTFNVDENNFGIEAVVGGGRYKMAGLDGVDFPSLPEKKIEGSFTIASNVLGRAISKTLFAAGNDDLRMNLTGLFLEIFTDHVNFVATDANKLVKFTRTDIQPGTQHNFIIPKKPLNLLKNALPDDDTEVLVEFNKNNAFFSFNNTQLICRLLDEKYPDYNAVIPSDNNNVVTIGRSDFLSAINRVSIFASKTTHQVRLKIGGNQLMLSAEDIEMANAGEETIACEYDGDDIEIGFNARFIRDMLSNLDGEQIQLRLSEPNRAGLLVPTENERSEEIVMLIMPMMLNNYN